MSDSMDRLDELLVEVASIDDFAELDRSAGEDATWWLVGREGRPALVEWDEASRRLTFSTEVGALPEVGRTAALERALVYNHDPSRTGGVRAGLVPTDDTLQLMADLHAEELESSRIVDVVTRLFELAESWPREWTEAGKSGELPPGESAPPGSVLA